MLDAHPNPAELAAEWIPFVAALPAGEGQRVAINMLTRFTEESTFVLDFMLVAADSPHAPTRNAAMSAFIRVPGDPRVRAKLVAMLADKNTEVRNAAIAHSASFVSAMGENTAVGALRVIPDPAQHEEALALLNALERAIKRLQDTGDGLDEGQRRIVDEVILPALEGLRRLFSGGVGHCARAQKNRLLTIFSLGNVIGAAKGVALATTTLANTPEAAATVFDAAQKLEPVFHLIGDLVS